MATTAAPKVVRVFMVDDTKHGFGVTDENTTAAQLIKSIATKIGLKDDNHFALFEIKGEEERCLGPDEKPVMVSDKLSTSTSLKNSFEPSSTVPEQRLVFKKKIFVRDEDELDSREYDYVAKHLLYIQAHHNVIEGEYPCTVEDAWKLGGLQMQVIYGNHNSETHVTGFFGPNLNKFVPKPLLPLKTSKEWETLILKSHSQRKGLPSEDAETEYLNIVKSWSYYGTKYFKNCRTISKNKQLPQKVMIGVNLDGIVLANYKDKEQQFGIYYFTDLLLWTTTHNGAAPGTFTFEVAGPNNEPVKYSFETKHADAINDLVQSYVDVLINMIKLDIGHETASPRE